VFSSILSVIKCVHPGNKVSILSIRCAEVYRFERDLKERLFFVFVDEVMQKEVTKVFFL